ncbi:uncharacterized protein UV8b_06481 [Ustilaginoidea virens]|uniref:Mannose-6-phosphate isomerase n=1 Tax=Ustilaginoidea virens TaxID=1159556 RepID=A0A8E5HV80_USTVR|nr:uncharacterized protein UV8b_06481 [Ustilaginoidea virens]QUC22240.1 hypothetical protein UV8b_06481 [Ustilaginoidea virens]
MSSTPRLFQMTGTCNNYPWGKKGRESLAARLRAKTPSHTDLTIQHDEAYSELWFGDYPDYPARVVESGRPLAEVIANDREGLLGSDSVQRFGENMPFLPKDQILSIAKALPLQTHPNKSLAAKLHQLHPDKFPDANHKPEIAVALSRFELFAGWKEIDQISPLFNLPSLRQFVPEGTREWDAETLRNVVRGLLKADEQTVQTIGEDLKQQSDHDLNKLDFRQSVADLVLRLQSQHSAIYLSGDILECMARSNNMLCGGLYPVADRDDIDLFCDSLLMDATTGVNNLRLEGKRSSDGARGHTTIYQPPISEFDVLRVDLAAGQEEILKRFKGPMVAMVISGQGKIVGDGKELEAKEGFIFFVGAGTTCTLRAHVSLQVFAAVVR